VTTAGDRAAAGAGQEPMPFDTTTAHIARVYDFWLGGKDNISQMASRCPYKGRTAVIQARHVNFSNKSLIAVRGQCCTSMGVMSDFLDGRS
jgi:S-adenosyl methyltransferase